ncbi:hypothetical protein TL16_g02068 [Triparma laevis f. inornata]|uniref:Uncharacterized protein n=2 Tax=Triparma laevis TaxID=1534972 RepID=A0A9W7FAC6_9STRA|nr:hypothetical protein TL16_g02068 [Triparma laevis f. inornata]GMI08846.1 hypothetical protein TrLO_g10180 [Triparma laevis f. longispina]
MADRARALERKKNKESLTSRLLQRPERWELHSAGVMEPEVPTNSQEPECQTVRARIKEKRQRQEQSDGRKPDFNTKIDNKGTMSRSQMAQELEAAELARQRELTIRRLAHHLKNRPPKEKILEKNIIPSFVNSLTGKEYYVLHSNDFHSPGKPLGVKTPNRFHKTDFEQCQAAITVVVNKRLES